MNSLGVVCLFSLEKGRFYFVASVVSTVLLISAPNSVFSRTWHINPGGSGDAPTIQAAITLASSGDTVLLAAGTYTGPGNRDVNFFGKGVVVRSENGPSVTVIDCQGLGRGFSFVSGEQRTAVVTGLTITNGSAQRGGAIYCHNGHPRIRGNVITGNSADYGGGICCEDPSGSPITNNVITHNTARYGGGVYCGLWSTPELVGNRISENNALLRGGGICGDDCWGLVISQNKISNNAAPTGGGISCSYASATISGNEIWGNTAATGGGMSLVRGASSNNDAIWDNTASVGAGIYYFNMSVGGMISGATIVENHGEGIFVDQSPLRIERTISAFNDGAGLSCTTMFPGYVPTVVCTDIFGNAGGDLICGVDGGGNIHADPLFCGTLTDSAYFLHADSPCAPGNSPCAALIGAFPAGCEPLPPPPSIVRCPNDSIIPAFSTLPLLILNGFTITNVDTEPRSYFYCVSSEGPAALVDNGDPASLSGVTPLLAPSGQYSPPPAALAIPAITTYCVQSVTYHAYGLGDPTLTGTCVTTVTFEPPVPVFVRDFTGESVDRGVQLTWSIIADDAVSGFRIYRARGESGNRELVVPAGILPPEVRTYLDTAVEAGHVYLYDLVVVLEDGVEVRSQTVSVETKAYALALHQNTPNPFNPATTISFTLPERAKVTLSIYEVNGRLVRTLVDETVGEGYQQRLWDGSDANGSQVGSGVYFYRLTAGDRTLTKKMVLLR